MEGARQEHLDERDGEVVMVGGGRLKVEVVRLMLMLVLVEIENVVDAVVGACLEVERVLDCFLSVRDAAIGSRSGGSERSRSGRVAPS